MRHLRRALPGSRAPCDRRSCGISRHARREPAGRFSSIVRAGNRLSSCETIAIPARAPCVIDVITMGSPSNLSSPESGVIAPATFFRSVDSVGAIGAREPNHFAFDDVQIHIAQGLHNPEALADCSGRIDDRQRPTFLGMKSLHPERAASISPRLTPITDLDERTSQDSARSREGDREHFRLARCRKRAGRFQVFPKPSGNLRFCSRRL